MTINCTFWKWVNRSKKYKLLTGIVFYKTLFPHCNMNLDFEKGSSYLTLGEHLTFSDEELNLDIYEVLTGHKFWNTFIEHLFSAYFGIYVTIISCVKILKL